MLDGARVKAQKAAIMERKRERHRERDAADGMDRGGAVRGNGNGEGGVVTA